MRIKRFSCIGDYSFYTQRMFDEKEENEKPKGSILGKTLAIGGGLAGLGYGGYTVATQPMKESPNMKKLFEDQISNYKKQYEDSIEEGKRRLENKKVALAQDLENFKKNVSFDSKLNIKHELTSHYLNVRDEASKVLNHDDRVKQLLRDNENGLLGKEETERRLEEMKKELRDDIKRRMNLDPNYKQDVIKKELNNSNKQIDNLVKRHEEVVKSYQGDLDKICRGKQSALETEIAEYNKYKKKR